MTPWQAHVAEWQNCDRCELCHGRDKVVLARGSLPADVLFVGEAPGDSEDTIGKPFVGPAGKKLDAMIARAQADAGTDLRLAFTNLVGCFPKESKRDGNGEPEPEHIQECAPRLDQLVKLAKPRLLVCVGGLAETWIAGDLSPKSKSKRHLLAWYDGTRIAVTHPAAILRATVAQQGLMVKRVVIALTDAFESLKIKE